MKTDGYGCCSARMVPWDFRADDGGRGHWPLQTHRIYKILAHKQHFTSSYSGPPYHLPFSKTEEGRRLCVITTASFQLRKWRHMECSSLRRWGDQRPVQTTLSRPAAASWWPPQLTISCCRITVWHRPENHFLQEVTLSELQHSAVSNLMAWIYFLAYSFVTRSYTIL